MARRPISNSIRFKVFDRDGFTCGYCGRTPPSVVLEVDHVTPVSAGGGNGLSNLLTACFECNRGKAARALGGVPPADYKKLGDEAKLRAQQLAAYRDYLLRLQEQNDEAINMVCKAFWSHQGPNLIFAVENASRERSQILWFINEIGLQAAIECAQASSDAVVRRTVRYSNQWRYFCGCLWKRQRGEQ